MSKRNFLIFGFVFFLLSLLITFFIKDNSAVKVPCVFVPQYEWILTHRQPGEVFHRLIKNHQNYLVGFTLFRTDRSDLLHFSPTLKLNVGDYLHKDAEVGYVKSLESRFRIYELESELKEQTSNLKVITSGEKSSVQQQFEEEYRLAAARFDAMSTFFTRKKELFAQNLISEEDWNVAQIEKKMLASKVSIAKARLANVQSGVKTEEVEAVKRKISNLLSQLELLNKKLEAERIECPISGFVAESLEEGTICKVINTDTLVVQLPVQESDIAKIEVGNKVEIDLFQQTPISLRTKIVSIGTESQTINNRPFYIVTALVDNTEYSLRPGSRGIARIRLLEEGIIEKFINSFRSMKHKFF
jgi:hypothetical protein